MERGRENSEYVYFQVLGSCICALEVYCKDLWGEQHHPSWIYYLLLLCLENSIKSIICIYKACTCGGDTGGVYGPGCGLAQPAGGHQAGDQGARGEAGLRGGGATGRVAEGGAEAVQAGVVAARVTVVVIILV